MVTLVLAGTEFGLYSNREGNDSLCRIAMSDMESEVGLGGISEDGPCHLIEAIVGLKSHNIRAPF